MVNTIKYTANGKADQGTHDNYEKKAGYRFLKMKLPGNNGDQRKPEYN